MKTNVIAHRGLDPDKAPYFEESTYEAFADQLSRGFGIEFDVQFTQDGKMIVIHDSSLKRVTKGSDERKISEVPGSEILRMDFGGCKLATLETILKLIEDRQKSGSISALHLKFSSQTPEKMDEIIHALRTLDLSKFMVFDASISSARYLKERIPELAIAASVSHPYDIERYNSVVGGTLLSMKELLENTDLFSWAWLDEWDTADTDRRKKTLYNEATFNLLREHGIRIALVTPELHGTSPGLLGGEAHEDARDRETLNQRLAEIIALSPDAVCTDHPDYVESLVS